MQHSYLKIKHHPPKRPKKATHNNFFNHLISRNQHSPFVKKHELELLGVQMMINGLNYHFRNFEKIERKARKVLLTMHEAMLENGSAIDPGILPDYCNRALHEVVAYLNVLGRVESFIISWWLKECGISEEFIANTVPSLLALTPLRNKCTAHRSFDDPHKTEKIIRKTNATQAETQPIEHLIETHLSLGIINRWGANLTEDPNLSYKISIFRNDRHKLLANYDLVKDIEYKKGDDQLFLFFIPSKHHKIIMDELIAFANKLFSIATKNNL